MDPTKVQITVEDSAFKIVNIKGSTTNEDYSTFNNFLLNNRTENAYLRAKENYYLNLSKAAASVTLSALKSHLDSLLPIHKQLLIDYATNWIKQHPNSLINSYVLVNYGTGTSISSPHIQENSLRKIYNAMPAKTKQNSWGKELAYLVNDLIVGSAAPDFEEPDLRGKPVRLSDFKGKYVLLDFWASWCTACRLETPFLIPAYKKYKDHKFTIISVSLDNNKSYWAQAIKKDGMSWIQVSELKHRKDHVVVQYNVNAIPMNYLIDPHGIIIAKDLHGKQLEETLQRLIN